jgi:hypothetical protein
MKDKRTGTTVPRILILGTKIKVSCQLQALAAYPWGRYEE